MNRIKVKIFFVAAAMY